MKDDERLTANSSSASTACRSSSSRTCESGITPDRSEQRSAGLAPSFAGILRAGRGNFVCTAWPVDDEAARIFARRLRNELLGLPPANGLPTCMPRCARRGGLSPPIPAAPHLGRLPALRGRGFFQNATAPVAREPARTKTRAPEARRRQSRAEEAIRYGPRRRVFKTTRPEKER